MSRYTGDRHNRTVHEDDAEPLPSCKGCRKTFEEEGPRAPHPQSPVYRGQPDFCVACVEEADLDGQAHVNESALAGYLADRVPTAPEGVTVEGL